MNTPATHDDFKIGEGLHQLGSSVRAMRAMRAIRAIRVFGIGLMCVSFTACGGGSASLLPTSTASTGTTVTP